MFSSLFLDICDSIVTLFILPLFGALVSLLEVVLRWNTELMQYVA